VSLSSSTDRLSSACFARHPQRPAPPCKPFTYLRALCCMASSLGWLSIRDLPCSNTHTPAFVRSQRHAEASMGATLCRAAAAFFYGPNPQDVAYISDAYRLLAPAVGTTAAKILFGVALLASGQNSTITGTLAGSPWVTCQVPRQTARVHFVCIWFSFCRSGPSFCRVFMLPPL
jgi:hypothetical protein